MPDAYRHEDDAEARIAALDVTRSFIVQAPAGSGKTELLIQRYLNLLTIVEDPEEILAITFTRKAAAEMQNRVLASLHLAERREEPREAHRAQTAAIARDVLARDRELNWQLVANPRRMRIQTLDALNASIARARPLSEPNSASGVRIVVDTELRTLHREAAVATLDWLAEDGEIQAATREILEHVDNNTGLYVAYLTQMLATRDQWLPFVGTGLLSDRDSDTLRGRFERNLEQTVSEHLLGTSEAIDAHTAQVLAELQRYAASQLTDNGYRDHPVCTLLGMDSLPNTAAEAISQWRGIAELLLTRAGTLRKKVDKRLGFPPQDNGEKQAMHELLETLVDNTTLVAHLHDVRALPPVCYSDEQWDVLLALFRLLPVAVSELQRLFAIRGVADHIEVAMTAGAALGTAEDPGDIALLLDYQVKHILVDEMQDTSSAQYRMLEALTGGWQPDDGRTLFCVGDPMQSIYRFRNAEVGQFLLARRFGIGGKRLEPLLLRRNFRSGQFLVDWFNTVFPTIFADDDDPASGAVSYSEAASVESLSGVGDCTVHPLFGSSGAQEAAAGCRVIAGTLEQFERDEMAVLVRSRTQLPGLLAELRRAGIDYRAVEIDRLTDLPEVIEVLALTRAAVHEGDRLAWLALLRAPWIGLDWSDLHALASNDTGSTVWELLHDRMNRLSVEGRHALQAAWPILEKLVAPRRSQTLRSLVETCWLSLGGPGILDDEYAVDNVYRYLDVLEQHERGGTLDDVAALESMLDQQRVSSDASARLQVMTMHRAKGLEFEHVLLYGLGRIPRPRERRVLSWYDVPGEHGDERKIISPVGPRSEVERDPVHRYIELAETRKDAHELARLLYVACTRAKKSLHIMGHTAVASDGESIRPPAGRSLLKLFWPAVEGHFATAFKPFDGIKDERDGDTWLEPVLKRFKTPWTTPAVEGLAVTDTHMPDAADEVEFYWVGTEARIAGTIVHRWLHMLAEGRADEISENPSTHVRATRRWLAETGVSGATLEEISNRVGQALHGVLEDERGRWLLEGAGRAEFALSGFYDGRLQSVILDRVRVDDDGTHWIVDYKTSTHEGGDLDGFLHAEADRYRPQLDKYAALYEEYSGNKARRALYFPLLQTFLEV